MLAFAHSPLDDSVNTPLPVSPGSSADECFDDRLIAPGCSVEVDAVIA